MAVRVAEDVVSARFLQNMRSSGWLLKEQPACRHRHARKPLKPDVYGIPPENWSGRAAGVFAVAFEIKARGLKMGRGVVEAVIQASQYSAAHAWLHNGEPLRRPDAVVVASPDLALLEQSEGGALAFSVAERFAWKHGVFILRTDNPTKGTVGFDCNIKGPASWLPLYEKGR